MLYDLFFNQIFLIFAPTKKKQNMKKIKYLILYYTMCFIKVVMLIIFKIITF